MKTLPRFAQRAALFATAALISSLPSTTLAWKVKVGNFEASGKDPGQVIPDVIPNPKQVLNDGLNAGRQAVEVVTDAQRAAQAGVSNTLRKLSETAAETTGFVKDVQSALRDVKAKLAAKELTIAQVRELIPQFQAVIATNQRVCAENTGKLRTQLQQAKESKVAAAVLAIAVRSLDEPMSQLTKEQVDGIVQSIVKDAPANELLNTKIIGNLRIIDFSVQGLYERFDKTGVQECIRTKLIESIKKDQPKDEAAFKIRVAEVASSCVNERLGRRAAAPSSTEPNTGPTTRQTPPTETPEDQAAAAQTMRELDQLEEGLRKLDDANRITQEVKDQVEKMSAPPSTPAPK